MNSHELWSIERVQDLIKNQVQESSGLEYKSAESLGRGDRARIGITKDVSAFANAGGGVLIYGVAEYQQDDKKHLPERIDPVSCTEYSREWLEQIVNEIRPKIQGIKIIPVLVPPALDRVVYIVDIPQSATAHQAMDRRYYRRHNFSLSPMEDYEIRDVMGRLKYPQCDLECSLLIQWQTYYVGAGNAANYRKAASLEVVAHNVGTVYALYVTCVIAVPQMIAEKEDDPLDEADLDKYVVYQRNNTRRDIVDVKSGTPFSITNRGTSWFDPILPEMSRSWTVPLDASILQNDLPDVEIRLKLYADNSTPMKKRVRLKELEVRDEAEE